MRVRPWPALALTAALLAGCGSSSAGAGAPAATTTTAMPPSVYGANPDGSGPTGGATATAPAPATTTGTTPAAPPATGTKPLADPTADLRPRAVAVDAARTRQRVIALSFDADMTPGMLQQLRSGKVASWYDADLIATLRRTETPATLFVSGLWAQTYPRVTKRLAADPQLEIGSHTWDHLAWTSTCYGLPSVSTTAEKQAEIDRTSGALERATGRRPVLFRFPGLCHEPSDLERVAAAGEQVIDGTASGDALQDDPAVIVRTVLGALSPGRIFVMHMMGGPNAPATGAAVRQLIPQIRERGYRMVTVGELLRHPTRNAPASQGGGA
jgi:peptidoglycan/xylan/chitin deacetylase (PgdA/CDA1 family)